MISGLIKKNRSTLNFKNYVNSDIIFDTLEIRTRAYNT